MIFGVNHKDIEVNIDVSWGLLLYLFKISECIVIEEEDECSKPGRMRVTWRLQVQSLHFSGKYILYYIVTSLLYLVYRPV